MVQMFSDLTSHRTSVLLFIREGNSLGNGD